MIKNLKLIQTIRFKRPVNGSIGGMYPGPYGFTMIDKNGTQCHMELDFFKCTWKKDKADPYLVHCAQECLDNEGFSDVELLTEYMLRNIVSIGLWRIPLDDCGQDELVPEKIESAVFEIRHPDGKTERIKIPCDMIHPTRTFLE